MTPTLWLSPGVRCLWTVLGACLLLAPGLALAETRAGAPGSGVPPVAGSDAANAGSASGVSAGAGVVVSAGAGAPVSDADGSAPVPVAAASAAAVSASSAASASPPLPVLLSAQDLLAVPWRVVMQSAADEARIDASLLEAVVGVESNFNPRAVSRLGAVGLMQLMPATATMVSGARMTRQALRAKLQDPQTNLRIGAQYLHQLLERFSNQVDLALAAYNAGIGNVLKAGGRVPPNRETPGFVQKVSQRYAELRAASASGLARLTAPPELAALPATSTPAGSMPVQESSQAPESPHFSVP